jgi:3-hydroxyisobutyrate dehydrogenase
MAFIDAPVSGGTVGAKNGTLTFMIGSETEDIFQVSFFKSFL